MEFTWAQVIYSSLPLLGVAIGGIATYMTQNNVLKKQLNRDIEREKSAENIERLKIYSEILRLEGEHIMCEYTGPHVEFNLKSYTREFRSIFFLKFYLLHQDLADTVREMDNIIAEANFNEELEPRQNDMLLNNFNKIINIIEKYLKEYREIKA
ncbi:hypothetical protein SAMN00017405_0371 [Desulfonispora thiosulfatigenes DSM 11270]|uniref:Uncharacterized protein n=1 Tax=Desulfonispora thiosulfatigenes DSM 11270 TaxID=656914 RepID=A0A1W1VPL5_DESTI|nr:hypothetical protein [Desulfonispora thiosulfatigenes]SMB95298.1 hypothetical protein SAMN00017405_0371 [Desulfonispora thiosulfatigenes DSM 11270]